MSRHASFRFAPEVTAPSSARHFVVDLLQEWDLGDLASSVELLISELVTNSVLHARTAGEVVVTWGRGSIRVEATDDGPGVPRVQDPEPEDPTGRGLSIVAQVADRWGVLLDGADGGKTVWFELDTASPRGA